MVRVVLAAAVILVVGALVAKFDDWLGPWGQFAAVIAGMFVVSAILPHYLYRGEPLLPDRHRRRH